MKQSGWCRIGNSSNFQYLEEDGVLSQTVQDIDIAKSINFIHGPKTKPRATLLRIVLLVLGIVALNIATLGISFFSDLDSSEIEGIGRLIGLVTIMYLSTKVGYRWFDGFLALIPFYGAFYIGRTIWRFSYLPHRYWSVRGESIPAVPKFETLEVSQELDPVLPNNANSTISNSGISSMFTSKKIGAIAGILGILTLPYLSYQYQFSNLLNAAETVQNRLNLYSDTFQSSKPKVNANGFAEYRGYYGDLAWEEFIRNGLRPIAEGTATELYVLNYDLEQVRVFNWFSKTNKSQDLLLEYYETFYRYVLATSKCTTNSCYSLAVEELDEMDAKWKIIASTLEEATPGVDLFGIEDKVARLLS